MDVIREPRRAFPANRFFVLGGIALVLVAIVAVVSLARGSGNVPTIARASIVTSAAQRGTLARSISAAGILASESVRIVDAVQPGVVESVALKPGAVVHTGDVIARMNDPDLEAAVTDARAALDVARALLISARQQARASALSQQSTLANAQAQLQEDQTDLAGLQSLHRSGYVADSTYRIARIKHAQSQRQVDLSRSAIDVDVADQQAKVAAAQAQVDQAGAQLGAKQTELDALTIRAGAPGVVQSIAVDPGIRVDAGAELARIADPTSLKAVLQVPEGQAHDVAVGMRADIDTGNGTVAGHVARIAPAALDGSVAVEVTFARALPSGSRPSLNVDGTIVLQNIPDALSIARPAGVSDDSTISLYRLDPGGSSARLTQVRVGRGSNERIAILSGLSAGDIVIVSDMTAYNGQNLVNLR